MNESRTQACQMFPKSAPDVAILDSLINPASLPRNIGLSRVRVAKNGIFGVSLKAVSKHQHGSVCARIIASRLRSVSILGIDIFGAQKAASLDRLLIGMEYAISQNPLIIHLSIGLGNHHRMTELEKICREAYEHGIILIAAASCRHETFPACFDSTLAVAAIEEVTAVRKSNAGARCWNIVAPGTDKNSRLSGSSIAAARVTHELLKSLLANQPVVEPCHTSDSRKASVPKNNI